MITGDQGLTALAVGRELGLLRDGRVRVLEAGELARLDANALRGVVREVDVFARVAPAQKYEIVRALQAGGEVVAMTGDGVNDGPALKAADIGVAMGQRGTEMARELADVVIMDDDFRSIVAAVENGRTLRANLQKALRFLLATNLAEVFVTFAATLVARAQPLSRPPSALDQSRLGRRPGPGAGDGAGGARDDAAASAGTRRRSALTR